MADTARTHIRVDPDVIEAVREQHGLAEASVSVVVRYALALAGGRDPAAVAYMPRGRARWAQRRREAGQPA